MIIYVIQDDLSLLKFIKDGLRRLLKYWYYNMYDGRSLHALNFVNDPHCIASASYK